MALLDVTQTVNAYAQAHPAAVPFAKQINDLIGQMQMAVGQGQQPQQVAAPPV